MQPAFSMLLSVSAPNTTKPYKYCLKFLHSLLCLFQIVYIYTAKPYKLQNFLCLHLSASLPELRY